MSRRWYLAGLIVLACICCSAQQDSLLIGAGDTISIQVLEAPELTQHVRVTDSGYVSLIVGGQVKVSGLTPAQASHAVEDALKGGDYVLNPHITIVVEQYATSNVTVVGHVLRPGSYPIGTPRTVMDVLAIAGGTTETADRHITIEHHATGQRVEYFLSNQSNAALDANTQVYPGDIVVVPKVDLVYVMGDVVKPGAYPIATNNGKLSIMQAVAFAGSQYPHAWQNKTQLIRKKPDGSYITMQVALGKMEKGKEADLALQPDDIIYIPFSYLKNIGTNLSSLIAATATAVIYHY